MLRLEHVEQIRLNAKFNKSDFCKNLGYCPSYLSQLESRMKKQETPLLSQVPGHLSLKIAERFPKHLKNLIGETGFNEILKLKDTKRGRGPAKPKLAKAITPKAQIVGTKVVAKQPRQKKTNFMLPILAALVIFNAALTVGLIIQYQAQ